MIVMIVSARVVVEKKELSKMEDDNTKGLYILLFRMHRGFKKSSSSDAIKSFYVRLVYTS